MAGGAGSTADESGERVRAWLEAKLGCVLAIARQGRWRPVWFADVERGGERLALCVRGDRVDMPLEPFMEFCLGWLRRNPPDSRGRESVIVWDSGQFHHANGRVVAVLDLEIGHVGDPLARSTRATRSCRAARSTCRR
jgi:hypothetical protein